MCKIIAICNQKGGVAKSFSTASLAVGLTRNGKKVLVIDNDPQGHASKCLGIQKLKKPITTIHTMMNEIIHDEEFEKNEGIILTEEKVATLPVDIGYAVMELELISSMNRERIMKEYVHTYKIDKVPATTKASGYIRKQCYGCGISEETLIPRIKTVMLSKSIFTYDGKKKTPTVFVKDMNGKTISSQNYVVTWGGGRRSVGTYNGKVTFKGDYAGYVNVRFSIIPKPVPFEISAKKKSMLVKWKVQKKEVTGYQIQYSRDKGFKKVRTVTIKKRSVASKKIGKLGDKKIYFVRMRSYKKCGGKTMYSKWCSAKYFKGR